MQVSDPKVCFGNSSQTPVEGHRLCAISTLDIPIGEVKLLGVKNLRFITRPAHNLLGHLSQRAGVMV
jgi:hypothetical protein